MPELIFAGKCRSYEIAPNFAGRFPACCSKCALRTITGPGISAFQRLRRRKQSPTVCRFCSPAPEFFRKSVLFSGNRGRCHFPVWNVGECYGGRFCLQPARRFTRRADVCQHPSINRWCGLCTSGMEKDACRRTAERRIFFTPRRQNRCVRF